MPPRPLLATLLAAALLPAAGCKKAPPPATAEGPSGQASSSGPAAADAAAVRPPFRCVERAELPPAGLAREAEAALAAGLAERALGCADEALRLAPRHVRALGARAEALAALDRPRDAQLAFARALAVDPDDPGLLAGAAELHVHGLEGAHDALEAGVELAQRGLRALTRVPRRDAALAGRLELAAAAGLNDLGRAAEGLRHADRALALAPADAAVLDERGFSLFELCRLDEARRAFERALAVAPDDARAHHHLGLLAERRGDEAEASRRLARARALAPDDFPPEVAIAAAEFEAEVRRAVASLSADDRAALRAIPVEAVDLPELADLTLSDPPLSPTILGLFRGPPLSEPCQPEDGDPCRSIVLYRRNLARFAHDRAELDRQVRVTLTHELGHLRGEDDAELRDRGLE